MDREHALMIARCYKQAILPLLANAKYTCMVLVAEMKQEKIVISMSQSLYLNLMATG